MHLTMEQESPVTWDENGRMIPLGELPDQEPAIPAPVHRQTTPYCAPRRRFHLDKQLEVGPMGQHSAAAILIASLSILASTWVLDHWFIVISTTILAYAIYQTLRTRR